MLIAPHSTLEHGDIHTHTHAQYTHTHTQAYIQRWLNIRKDPYRTTNGFTVLPIWITRIIRMSVLLTYIWSIRSSNISITQQHTKTTQKNLFEILLFYRFGVSTKAINMTAGKTLTLQVVIHAWLWTVCIQITFSFRGKFINADGVASVISTSIYIIQSEHAYRLTTIQSTSTRTRGKNN